MRFGSTAKELAKCKLEYCRISECRSAPVVICHCSRQLAQALQQESPGV